MPISASKHPKLGDNLIFVISQPRAGSTLLQRILFGHPDIHSTAEPWLMLHPTYAIKERGLKSEFDASLARAGLKDFLSQIPEGESFYYGALRDMCGRLYNRAIDVVGKKIFVDKTPRYYLIIPELKRIFPNAKFVLLLRNPLAVLSSTLKTWFHNQPEQLINSTNYMDVVKGPICMAKGMKQIKEDAIIVRYEDLVSDTEEQVRHLCKQLDIDFHKEMLNYGSREKPFGRFGDAVGIDQHDQAVSCYADKWKDNLSDPGLIEFGQACMEKIGQDVFDTLGYPYDEIRDTLTLMQDRCKTDSIITFESARSIFRSKERKALVPQFDKKKSHSIEFPRPSNESASVDTTQSRWPEDKGTIQNRETESQSDSPILISAIVSTCNAERFIHGCLQDLEDQSIADRMEIIVVDSASEQNEVSIVRDFQKRYANIRYIRTAKRESVYQAWNRGIKLARGKYITNANTDDRHRRDAFEQMVRVLERDETIALVYADVLKTKTANETFEKCIPTGVFRWHDWNRDTLLKKGCFIGPQPMWRKSVHDTHGYFDENYTVSADFEFWLRISQTCNFYHIKRPLGLYLERPDSVEHANAQKKRQEDMDIIRRYREAQRRKKRITGPVASGHADTQEATHKVPGGYQTGGFSMMSQETILAAARTLLDDGQKQAAHWAMEKALADQPEDARLNNETAALAYELGEMQRAALLFTRAVELDPMNVQYLKNLADFCYVVRKDAEQALDLYQRILEIDADHSDALILAGHVSTSLHRYSDAQQYYQRAEQLSPGNLEIQEILSKIRHSSDDREDAQDAADDLYAAAQQKVQGGDCNGAVSLLKKLLSIDSAHALAHNDMGVLLFESGETQSALRHYEKAAELKPENIVLQKNLADYYWYQMKDPQRAMQQYVQVLKLDPQDIETLLSCGQICLSVGKAADARDFYQTALQIEPVNEDARQLLGQVEEREIAGESIASIEPQTETAQNSPIENNSADTISAMQRRLSGSPDSAELHNDLGVLHYEAGDKDKALEYYERAVELDPDTVTYSKNLADFYFFELDRPQEALKLYVRVLETVPRDTEALTAIGTVCSMAGKHEDAFDFFSRALDIEPWNEAAKNALEQLKRQANFEMTDNVRASSTG